MSTFNPGDVVIHSTWCGPELLTPVDAWDSGLIVRASDGHESYWPTSPSISLGDLLSRFRHPTPEELALYSFDERMYTWGASLGARVRSGDAPAPAWRNHDGSPIDWRNSDKPFPRGYRDTLEATP